MDDDRHEEVMARVQQATEVGCLRWMSHEATRGLVDAVRPDVLGRLWPQIQPLVCGDETWVATFVLATCAGLRRGDFLLGWPSRALRDGKTDPIVRRWLEALFDQDPTLAYLALDLIVEMAHISRALAERLQDAGVPIIPDEPSDLAPLVSLLLINPEQLDWTRPELLARNLPFFGGYAYLGDGAILMLSDRLNDRQKDDAGRLRDHFRAGQAGFSGNIVRVRGGRPEGSATVGSLASTLAEVLPEVLRQFPDTTAAGLHREWFRPQGTAGRLLRDLMGKGPSDAPPSLSTLQKALKKLRP